MSRILVVDDEAGFRRSLSRLLETDGHEVTAVGGAGEARELIDRLGFDIIITDIVMAGESGVALLESIRRAALDVPVILITGHPTTETAIKAVKLGAIDYLTKPFTHAELKRAVSMAAKAGAERGENRRALAGVARLRPVEVADETGSGRGPTDEIRIAVIDDEQSVVNTVERILESRGYRTQGISESIGVSAKIKAFDPHIIILDLSMPAMDGKRMIEVLRKTLTKMPRVIIFSGLDEKEIEQTAVEVQVDDYVNKNDGLFRLLGRVNLLAHQIKTASPAS